MSRKSFDDPHGTSVEARQALLDNRCEHGAKRHRTNGRRKRMSAAKRTKIKHRIITREARFRKFKDKVAAYWNGDAAEHPHIDR